MRSAKTLLLLLFCALLPAQALHAAAYEGDYFSISGTVTDANWNPIPGALVTLYDNDFNRITTQDTNENGNFYFQNVAVKTYLCTVRVSYTENGTEHKIPGYYIKHYPANGVQYIDPWETHFDDYYLPGSVPRISPTPAVAPTAAPAPTPMPAAEPNNNAVTSILLFVGGFIPGAAVATLACFILLRSPKKP